MLFALIPLHLHVVVLCYMYYNVESVQGWFLSISHEAVTFEAFSCPVCVWAFQPMQQWPNHTWQPLVHRNSHKKISSVGISLLHNDQTGTHHTTRSGNVIRRKYALLLMPAYILLALLLCCCCYCVMPCFIHQLIRQCSNQQPAHKLFMLLYNDLLAVFRGRY